VSRPRWALPVALVATLWCAGSPASAQRGSFTLTLENDLFTGSDNNYTNGVGLTWTTSELAGYDAATFQRRWAAVWSFLPGVPDDGERTWASWTLGQEMHTPDDITDPDPPLDDQPYAGVLFVDSALHARHGRWGHTWNLRIGLVGPSSLAGQAQREWHGVIGAEMPRGWRTQLGDEPILNIDYTAGCVVAAGRLDEDVSWRLVPIGGISVGNYLTGASLGGYGEIGWNLADAVGGATLQRGLSAISAVGAGRQDRWSLSFFAGVSGHGVAHYLPLDGGVLQDGRSVGSNSFIGLMTGGVSFRHGSFAVSLAQTYYTETFETERRRVDFGTVTLSWFF